LKYANFAIEILNDKLKSVSSIQQERNLISIYTFIFTIQQVNRLIINKNKKESEIKINEFLDVYYGLDRDKFIAPTFLDLVKINIKLYLNKHQVIEEDGNVEIIKPEQMQGQNVYTIYNMKVIDPQDLKDDTDSLDFLEGIAFERQLYTHCFAPFGSP